jgi:hypothetical protein
LGALVTPKNDVGLDGDYISNYIATNFPNTHVMLTRIVQCSHA